MKKTITLTLGAFLISWNCAFSQITITDVDIADPPKKMVRLNDTTPSITLGGTGLQTWDFSSLGNDFEDTTMVVDPATTPFGANFPSATIAMYVKGMGGTSTYTYLKKDSAKLEVLGNEIKDPFIGNVGLPLSPPMLQLEFPSTDSSSFAGVSSFSLTGFLGGDTISTTPVTTLDSFRYSGSYDRTSVIDAYGNVTTPLSVYDCLRQKITEIQTVLVEIHTTIYQPPFPPFPMWQTIQSTVDTIVSYSFWANGIGVSVVDVQTDSLGNPSSVNYLKALDTLINTNPVAQDDYKTTPFNTAIVARVQTNDDDPEGGIMTTSIVTNPSNGTAVVLDGDSIQYIPDSTFSGDDTVVYEICDNGNPVLCDTALLIVTVSAPNQAPAANDDTLNMTMNDTMNINVQANDTDPDGFGGSVSLISGPQNGVAYDIFGFSFDYIPNNNFTGNDTFYYQFCDYGTPQLCDTAMVVITVNPPLGMNNIINDLSVILYPNPASSQLNFKLQYNQPLRIAVYNSIGAKVYERELQSGHNRLDLDGFGNGIYFYELMNRDNKVIYKGKYAVAR